MMRLWATIVSLISACRALSKSSAASRRSAKRSSSSATAVLMTVLVSAMEAEEPSMRNSNLLPVKANGEVRLRSVVSLGKRGSVCTPTFRTSFSWLP